MQFSSDDALVVSTNEKDPNIFVWDTLSGTEEMTLVGHRDVVNDLAFKFASPILASASQDTYIRVWDMDSGRMFPEGASLGSRVIHGCTGHIHQL